MVVRLLIDNGADVNASRCVFRTPRLSPPLLLYIRVAAILAARHIIRLLQLVCFFRLPRHHIPFPYIEAKATSALIHMYNL